MWEAGKTQYVRGALWDIGIAFRGLLCRFTVFGAWTYDMVIHKSEICIKLLNCNCRCSWFYIMGSCSMQALWGGHHEIFSYVSTAGTLQEGSHVGTGWICEHLCTRRVSLRYRYGYRFGTGETLEKKEQFHNQHQHKWTSCISRYCKVSLLVVHHVAFHSL